MSLTRLTGKIFKTIPCQDKLLSGVETKIVEKLLTRFLKREAPRI
nr:MAG TPA: hypothetical protein [Caudoviricetes sp.]